MTKKELREQIEADWRCISQEDKIMISIFYAFNIDRMNRLNKKQLTIILNAIKEEI